MSVRESPTIALSRDERILKGRRRGIINRRKPMRCEWCYGKMFVDGKPCTHCFGGSVSCCGDVGDCDASIGSHAQMESGRVTQRLEERAESNGSETSGGNYDE